MNITCPFCQTVFEVDPKILLKKNTTNVKCSVCKNTWVYTQKKLLYASNSFSYMKIFMLNILLLFAFVVSIVLFKENYNMLGGFWTELYIFIESSIPIK